MCTISWRLCDRGYDLYFNRDEQVTRPRALVPAVKILDGLRAIMPIDPQGGGSWLATNACGMSYALLNFYQGRLPKGRLISRGNIVKQCALAKNTREARTFLTSLNLSKYAPFSLLIFDPFLCNSGQNPAVSGADKLGTRVTMLRWTGRALDDGRQKSPLISSAVDFEEVYKTRIGVYRDIVQAKTAEENDALLRAFHASHEPAKSARSICMHREDAKTVSFSHVKVREKAIEYYYSDGAPCEVEPQLAATIKRNV